MPSLRVCPFSVAVFFGSAAWITYQLKQQQKNKQTQKDQELPVCQVVFVLGAPGVGKGTQCQLLTERLTATQWVHLSAGDLLRAERGKSHSRLADEINACIAAGDLVRSEVTCQLLENAMREAYQKDAATHFLVDGFPRSQANADAWEATMSHHRVQFVLDFECSEEILVGRLLERGKTTGRSDDNLETVRKRFRTFQNETAPILEYYRKGESIPVYTIATDKAVEDVYQETVKYFA